MVSRKPKITGKLKAAYFGFFHQVVDGKKFFCAQQYDADSSCIVEPLIGATLTGHRVKITFADGRKYTVAKKRLHSIELVHS